MSKVKTSKMLEWGQMLLLQSVILLWVTILEGLQILMPRIKNLRAKR